MKLGKLLKRQIEQGHPAWREHFLRYKELRRVVTRPVSGRPPSPAEFVTLLHAEIDKINAFFIEQEEVFIIRHRELQEAIKKAVERKAAVPPAVHEAEIAAIRREMVNFHAEMVLLLNCSSINYIGNRLAKIVKKYEGRTGVVLRPAVIETVQRQHFVTAETVSRMARECEAMSMEAAFPTATATEGQGTDRQMH